MRKKSPVGAVDKPERKSYVKVRSEEMLVPKDEKFGKECEKSSQGRSHPQYHKEVERPWGQKTAGEPGGWEAAVISSASLFSPSRELSRCSAYWVPRRACHARICGQGAEPEEGIALSNAGGCMGSGEGP